MLFLSDKKSERSAVTSEAAEMRGYIQAAVASREGRGQLDAVNSAARELKLSPRRVLTILRGQIRRVWADELTGARDWYRAHLEQQARLLEQKAATTRALAQEYDEKWPNG